MLSFNVFANQNLRRSTSPSQAAVRSLHFSQGDKKPVTTTLLVPVAYKCPLSQTFSLHILTNAPGVCVHPPLLLLFGHSLHSLHQECFTTLLQSNDSTLFLKTAGCIPTIPILELDPACPDLIGASLPPVTSHKSPVTCFPPSRV